MHKNDVTPDQLLGNAPIVLSAEGNIVSKDDAEIQDLLAMASELQERDGIQFQYPPEFPKYWAKKTNKTWLKPSDELK